MTGSGPTVFGVFSSSGPAEAARDHLISQDAGDVFLVRKWEREDNNANDHRPMTNDK
jgi:4-diphosphocytidyl-2C-methyl-D-erythritol kinase